MLINGKKNIVCFQIYLQYVWNYKNIYFDIHFVLIFSNEIIFKLIEICIISLKNSFVLCGLSRCIHMRNKTFGYSQRAFAFE